MFTHETITNLNELNKEDLHDLQASWGRLTELFETPLLSFDWFYCCATTIHKNDELRIIIIKENNEISAIAPLFIQKRKGYHRLEILGTSILHEPCGLLYTDEKALSYLVQTLIQLKFPISLLRIPEHDKIHSVNKKFKKQKAIIISRSTAPSAYIVIDSHWESFLGKLSPNRRYDLKRKRKKAEKTGEVDIEIINPTIDEFDNLFDTALQIENKSWKGQQGSSLLKKPHLREFFYLYTKKACEKGILRFFFLTINQDPVALHIALEENDTLWILKLAHLSKLSRCSPGIQLAHASIQYCFDTKLAQYEFLGSEEPWQSSWPIDSHNYTTILLFPYSIRGITGMVSIILDQLKKIISPRN